MRFEERAQKYEYKFTDTDDQIVEYIAKNKQEAIQLSIQSLAARFFTVPNTVTRLARKLGYDGFSQLKNSLKDEVCGERDEPQDNLHANIHKTLDLIDPEKMDWSPDWFMRRGASCCLGWRHGSVLRTAGEIPEDRPERSGIPYPPP